MANCSYCNTGIFFGGITDENGRKYCNANCHAAGYCSDLASEVPSEQIDKMVEATRNGPCPKCNQSGSPVDVYKAHKIWSMLVLTSWSSEPELSCKSCATKRQCGAILLNSVIGWWGFPWGIIGTPVQIFRNLGAIAASPKQSSPLLYNHVRVTVGQRLAEDLQNSQQTPPPLPSQAPPPLPNQNS